ncbi:MAG: putative rod shape-determining protein MreD [Mycobacterium sp.]|nr:putative rod shape-determining protein MreD [Mycobacterium sp.]
MTLTAPRTEEATRAPAGQNVGLVLSPPSGRSVSEQSIVPVEMTATAAIAMGVLLLIAVLLQRILLPGLPHGPADLVTVLVACFALFAGPVTGCVAGFGAGLFADALSDHAFGRLAAVLCIVGYLCGLLADRRRLRLAWPAMAAACVATALLFALTGALVGDHRAGGDLLLTRCLAGAGYALVIAPVAYVLAWRMLTPRRRRLRPRNTLQS